MKSKLAIAISAALLTSASYANTEMELLYGNPEISRIHQYNKSAFDNGETNTKRFIVEFKSDSIVTHANKNNINTNASGTSDKKLNLQSAKLQSYESQLHNEREAFSSELSQSMSDSKVELSFTTLFNGVTVSGDSLTVEKLMNMPNVKAVYPEEMYHQSMDASLDVINAPAFWDKVSGMENAGKGVKVAIIDSGIRPENPMFSGEGFATPDFALPTDDYCRTTDATFCNNKLIVARWSQPTGPVCKDEYLSPLGYGGHGTHVAGSAVGNKVKATYKGEEYDASGVAPAAYLMVYKALYSGANCSGGSGSNIMLMEALEHAVKDGADVINNSWGGGAGADPATSPYTQMFEAAEKAGIVVVSAAGNDGNGASTIGCPACIESGIAVANSTTGRYFTNSFEVNSKDYLAIEGSNGKLKEDVLAPIVASVKINEKNVEGCEPFPADSFKDSIALISRGSCAFSAKATNAKNAGAKGLVVYNNKSGAPFIMALDAAEIPTAMITKSSGEELIKLLGTEPVNGTMNSKVKRVVEQSLIDTINSSSSRGPNGNPNFLKPDLAAPGTNILSAYSPDDGGQPFNVISGTSMASPHVAGAAALMKQMHKDWSAIDIKTALTSSSKHDGIKDDDAETPASPFAMGAGRLDLEAAAKAVLTFDKPSFASDVCVGQCTFTRTVHNKTDKDTSWNVSAQLSGGAITVSPENLAIKANSSAKITVTIDSTFAEYESWMMGRVTLKNDDGLQQAHLPIAVRAKESSDSSLISIAATDSDITSNDKFGIKGTVTNTEFRNTVTVTSVAPEGTSIESKDDVNITVSNGVQNGSEINVEQNRVTWVGRLALPTMSFSNTSGFASIFANGASAFTCGEQCDEVAYDLDVPGNFTFKYNGKTYDKLTVSDNGIIVAGGGSVAGSYRNREFPNSILPNNVIAPFWSDFDLDGSSASDTGSGRFGMGLYRLTDDTLWLAIEWNDVQRWGRPNDPKYTFATWIRLGDTEEIRFNYLDVPSMPSRVTIGAENVSGSLGVTRYHNGEGTPVTSNSAIALRTTQAGKVEIDYSVKLEDFNIATSDSVTTDEEKMIAIDVLANDKMVQKVARISMSGDGKQAKAQRLIDIKPNGDLTDLKIVDEPKNGRLVLKEGQFEYTPNDNFFGTDSFTYTVADASKLTSKPAMVKVAVQNINDAPVVAPEGTTATEQNSATLKSNATDVDNDKLTYKWTQKSGEALTFNATSKDISVTANKAGTYTFEVVANDGKVESNKGTATLTVEPQPKKSGSLGWLALLLLPVAALRRKRS
ncbi:MAG: S8 family serine peptidase [Parashewanella sp.]